MEAVFLSRAEQVARFQKATPLRFRSQPRNSRNGKLCFSLELSRLQGFKKQLLFGSVVNQGTPGMGSTVVDCQQGSSCLRLNQRPSSWREARGLRSVQLLGRPRLQGCKRWIKKHTSSKPGKRRCCGLCLSPRSQLRGRQYQSSRALICAQTGELWREKSLR